MSTEKFIRCPDGSIWNLDEIQPIVNKFGEPAYVCPDKQVWSIADVEAIDDVGEYIKRMQQEE